MSYEPTKADSAKVVGATVEILLETGYQVTVNNLPAKEDRPQGMLIFIAGLTYEDGEFKMIEAEAVPA